MTEGDIRCFVFSSHSFGIILRNAALPRRGPAEQLVPRPSIQHKAALSVLESIPVTCAFPF